LSNSTEDNEVKGIQTKPSFFFVFFCSTGFSLNHQLLTINFFRRYCSSLTFSIQSIHGIAAD